MNDWVYALDLGMFFCSGVKYRGNMTIVVIRYLAVLGCLVVAGLGSFGVVTADPPSLVISRRFDAAVFFVDDVPVTKVYGSYRESLNVTFTLYGNHSLVDVDHASFISLVNQQAFGTRYRWSETPYVRLIKPASVEGVRDVDLLQPWNLSYRGEEQELRLANHLVFTRSHTMMVVGSLPIYYGRFQTGFELQFAEGETVVTDTLTVYEVELRLDQPGPHGSLKYVKVGDHFSPVDEELSLAEMGLRSLTVDVADMAGALTGLQQRFDYVETENRRLLNLATNLTASQLPLQQALAETRDRVVELESQNYHLQWQLETALENKEDLQGSVDRLTTISVAFLAATVALIGGLLWMRRKQY